MGNPAIAAAAAATGSGSSTFLILIVVFIGLIYFMAIRPGRNRQKKVAQQQNTVLPGARVRTTAGMYATVVAVDGDDVVLEVSPDIEVRYMKRSIMEVLAPGDETDLHPGRVLLLEAQEPQVGLEYNRVFADVK